MDKLPKTFHLRQENLFLTGVIFDVSGSFNPLNVLPAV